MDGAPASESSQTLRDEGQVLAYDIRPEALDPTTFPPPPVLSRKPFISVDPHHTVLVRHPHYVDQANVLLKLFAPDSSAGGIEFGVIHAACGVISGNRWNGWFAMTIDGSPLNLTYGDVLKPGEYYFHLPESSIENPYAIVPNFREWDFPHQNLHPCWTNNQSCMTSARSRFATASSRGAAVNIRDQSCRMSAFEEGTHAAHLCPRSEEIWFGNNGMSQYILNPLLDPSRPIDDATNALLLRADLHAHFDAHKFVFVPKKHKGDDKTLMVTHMLFPSRELGLINHNVCLKAIPDVEINFLFARFAWSIFTHLPNFLKGARDRRLFGTTISTTLGLPQLFSSAEYKRFLPGPKSRSQSPTKRPRRRSDDSEEPAGERRNYHKRCMEEDDADESTQHHKRQRKIDVTTGSFSSTSENNGTVDEVVTPVKIQDLKVMARHWLEKERLRSDPHAEWLKEKEWAHHIRDGQQVMGPADIKRLQEFMGFEHVDETDDENIHP